MRRRHASGALRPDPQGECSDDRHAERTVVARCPVGSFRSDDVHNDYEGACAAGMQAALFDPTRKANVPMIATPSELLSLVAPSEASDRTTCITTTKEHAPPACKRRSSTRPARRMFR